MKRLQHVGMKCAATVAPGKDADRRLQLCGTIIGDRGTLPHVERGGFRADPMELIGNDA